MNNNKEIYSTTTVAQAQEVAKIFVHNFKTEVDQPTVIHKNKLKSYDWYLYKYQPTTKSPHKEETVVPTQLKCPQNGPTGWEGTANQ